MAKKEKLVNNKMARLVLFVLLVGFLIANLGTIIGYVLLGAVVIVGGIIGYSFIETLIKKD